MGTTATSAEILLIGVLIFIALFFILFFERKIHQKIFDNILSKSLFERIIYFIIFLLIYTLLIFDGLDEYIGFLISGRGAFEDIIKGYDIIDNLFLLTGEIIFKLFPFYVLLKLFDVKKMDSVSKEDDDGENDDNKGLYGRTE